MFGPFVHDSIPGRVVFGVGSRHSIDAEADLLAAERIVLVASASEAARRNEITSVLDERIVGHFADVAQHVPVGRARDAIALTRELGADTILAIGGGSAVGFGKAIALELDVNQIVVPTTYSGSEMTTIWGMTDGDHKQTGRSARVKPDTVVYDPELTLGLPVRLAGPSGMNALAHAVEAMYGPGANPVTDLLALEAMGALRRGLPAIVADDSDLQSRSQVLYGAYLAGAALATGGTALHHKTCHVLGGMFGLSHGDMNGVVLGHAVAYNATAIPQLVERMATTFDVPVLELPGALFDLAAEIGAPTSLEQIGMPADGIDEAARRVVAEAAMNVREPVVEGIRAMLDNAFHGRRPRINPVDSDSDPRA